MFKIICLSVATGVIALSAAVPVVSANSRILGEPATMLLAATAFFGLASVMRQQSKGPRR
jgi:hypothetical protein